VDKGQRRLERSIAQIGVEILKLSGEQESLVDDAAAGHAADISLGNRLLDEAAHDEELALERGLVRIGLSADEKLADHRAGFARGTTDFPRNGRNVAPGDDPAALGGDDFLDLRLVPDSAEQHGDAVLAGFGQLLHVLAKKLVRKRKQQPRAVAGVGIASRRAAVHQPLQHSETHSYNFVRRHVVEVGDQADAARVMLVPEAVEPAVGYRRPVEPLCRVLLLLPQLFHKIQCSFLN